MPKRFLGRKARLYYNSATYESPMWVRVETRNTLSVSLAKSTEDVSAEDSDGETWEQTIMTQRTLTFEAFMLDTEADNTVMTAIQTAYETDAPMEFAIARGDITTVGVKVRRLPGMLIHQADEGYDLNGAAKLTVSAKPGPSDDAPSTFTVSE